MKNGIVIVTYNRLNLLKICIEHIKKQSLVYNQIIVINNCSTDGTKEYLDCLDDIYVENLSENLGGAGGFATGVKIAMNLGCDWVTLIDDDAILDKNYLYNLMLWQNEHKGVKAMCGAVYTKNKIATSYARRIKVDNNEGIVHVWNVPKSEYLNDFFYCDMVSFCGVTFATDIIKEIGYPEDKYFILFDDTEYTLRMSKKTRIALVTNAIIDHRANGSGGRSWRLYYKVRNELHVIKKHFGYKYAWSLTRRRITQINQFIRDNSITRQRKSMIWAGIIDAWFNCLGKHKKFGP